MPLSTPADAESLSRSAKKIAALEQQARDLAILVEKVRQQTLSQSNQRIEALEQKARDLALFVETVRKETRLQSETEIEALGQKARDLAVSVETVREKTLLQSETEIAALGQQARDLAVSVETVREETLFHSDTEIAALGRQARELAVSVEAVREETLLHSDTEIAALGQQTRDLTRDVTERKCFERALQEKNLELENANLAKDRFLASMSHELRTPLNAILGFTGTLLMKLPGPLTPDQDKQLRIVQASARHLLSLINDLLDVAKIESGKVEINLDQVACQGVLDEVVAALRPAAAAKGLEFEATVSPPDLLVRADRRALSQILLNLASNAIKFTEQGRVSIVVSRLEASNQVLVCFSVADTGIGIRAEDQAGLFQAFTQVPGSRMQRQEGTGLGLHLSRKLAELLGGHIALQSEWGKGSTFTLVLLEA
jgi:signal transduction histidine kinase